MRIIADQPLELLRALVNEHLPRVIPADGIGWLSDDSLPEPNFSRYVTLPPEVSTILDPEAAQAAAAREAAKFTPINLSALDTRIVLWGPAPAGGGDVRFDIAAAIGPDFPTPILLLASDGTVVHASHTNMAVDENGMIQIGGYESRVSLMTTAEIRAERGKRVLLGGTCVTAFAVERRSDGGPWSPINVQFDSEAVKLREVRAE